MTTVTSTWSAGALALVLIMSAAAAAQESDPAASEEAEMAPQEDVTRGTDLVVGLNAFNRQVLAALGDQPTRRVIILSFPDLDGQYTRASEFIRQQLVTAIAATQDYQIVPDSELEELARSQGIAPMELANSDAFRGMAQRYANDSIVAGTLTDLGSKLVVMARIINGRSGQYGGGAIVYLNVNEEVASLLAPERRERTSEAMQPLEEKPVEAMQREEAKPQQRMVPQQIDKPKPQTTTAAQSRPAQRPNVEGKSDLQIYRLGRARMEKKQYREAFSLFDEMVNRYPESALADNAVYWMGECYYGLKDWRAALETFQRVLDQYPYGNKVPAATLKRGYVQEQLGDLDAAIASMQEVISRFPDSDEAAIAKRKLQLLRAAKQ